MDPIFSNFSSDQTFFQTPNLFQKLFLDPKSILEQNLFGPTISLDPKLFVDQKFLWDHNFFRTENLFGPNICLGLRDFPWRREIKLFQAEHFRIPEEEIGIWYWYKFWVLV